MPRLSILGLMGFVLSSAVAVAALRNANELWAGSLMLAVGFLLGASVLCAIYLRGREQAWWLGFGLFAGGYLIIALGPWSDGSTERSLATAPLLRYVNSRVAQPRVDSTAIRSLIDLRSALIDKESRLKRLVRNPSDPTIASVRKQIAPIDAQLKALRTPSSPASPEVRRWRSALPGAADYASFRRVGHCLLALLAGLSGAITACRVQARGLRITAPMEEGRGEG